MIANISSCPGSQSSHTSFLSMQQIFTKIRLTFRMYKTLIGNDLIELTRDQIILFIQKNPIMSSMSESVTSEEDINLDNFFKELSPQKYQERFQKQEILGSGAGSNVYQAWDASGNRNVAIKKYKTQIFRYFPSQIVREIVVLQFFSSQQMSAVLKLFDCIKVNGRHKTQYCLVTELCYATLEQQIMEADYSSRSLSDKIQICLDVARGVKKFHEAKMVHRDLKPANIFMTEREGKKVAIIGDLGHSKRLTAIMTQHRGTPMYTDPYLAEKQDYSYEWDIYSLGVIFYEVLAGQYIFPMPIRNLREEIDRLVLNIKENIGNMDEIPDLLKPIIQSCLRRTDKANIEEIEQGLEKILAFVKNEPSHEVSENNFTKNRTRQTTEITKDYNSSVMSSLSFVKESISQQNLSSSIKSSVANSKIGSILSAHKPKRVMSSLELSRRLFSSKLIESEYEMLSRPIQKHNSSIWDAKVKQMLSSKQANNKKIQQIQKCTSEFSSLQAADEKIKKIRQIESLNISDIIKKQLTLFAFCFNIIQIQKEIVKAEESGKVNYLQRKYLEKLLRIVKPLHEEIKMKNQSIIGKRVRDIVNSNNIYEIHHDYLKEEFLNLVAQIQGPERENVRKII